MAVKVDVIKANTSLTDRRRKLVVLSSVAQQEVIDDMREYLKDAQPLKKFDCQVFESIVEKVIIGGYDDSGNADPLKITFVYKTGFTDDKDGTDFKHSRRHIGGPKPGKSFF
jgi:site-specific DNA recombinase